MVTVQLPLKREIHAAVLEDDSGRFGVGCQEEVIVRIGVQYVRGAIELYEEAIHECEMFIRDLDADHHRSWPLAPGRTVP